MGLQPFHGIGGGEQAEFLLVFVEQFGQSLLVGQVLFEILLLPVKQVIFLEAARLQGRIKKIVNKGDPGDFLINFANDAVGQGDGAKDEDELQVEAPGDFFAN